MKITKKQVSTVLRGASFNPSDAGPMRVIVEVGDWIYYAKRAQEFLIQSEHSPTKEQRRKYLDTAIKLITLAIIDNENR